MPHPRAAARLRSSERRLELLPLAQLVAAARNPKRHDLDAIAGSVGRFGYVDPVVIDERTGRLVSGHGRVEALKRLHEAGGDAPDGVKVRKDGTWLVPTMRGWASISDAEAEAYLLAANQTVHVLAWARLAAGLIIRQRLPRHVAEERATAAMMRSVR